MRRTLFVGNWKSNKNIAETEAYLAELPQYSSGWQHEVVLMPSFVSLHTASQKLTGDVKLGAQDVSHLGVGACCGDIPASLLKSVGVKYCLVGHYDRRAMGETNDRINQKLKNLIASEITPILCIGESLNEYNSDKTREVVDKQLRECLVGVKEIDKIVIAYQPIWTVGTGHNASSEYIGIIADYIRKTVKNITGNAMSVNFTLLYGGGPITNMTAKMFLETPDIDGLMSTVGSLKPSTFSEIIKTEFKIRKSYLE